MAEMAEFLRHGRHFRRRSSISRPTPARDHDEDGVGWGMDGLPTGDRTAAQGERWVLAAANHQRRTSTKTVPRITQETQDKGTERGTKRHQSVTRERNGGRPHHDRRGATRRDSARSWTPPQNMPRSLTYFPPSQHRQSDTSQTKTTQKPLPIGSKSI